MYKYTGDSLKNDYSYVILKLCVSVQIQNVFLFLSSYTYNWETFKKNTIF